MLIACKGSHWYIVLLKCFLVQIWIFRWFKLNLNQIPIFFFKWKIISPVVENEIYLNKAVLWRKKKKNQEKNSSTLTQRNLINVFSWVIQLKIQTMIYIKIHQIHVLYKEIVKFKIHNFLLCTKSWILEQECIHKNIHFILN